MPPGAACACAWEGGLGAYLWIGEQKAVFLGDVELVQGERWRGRLCLVGRVHGWARERHGGQRAGVGCRGWWACGVCTESGELFPGSRLPGTFVPGSGLLPCGAGDTGGVTAERLSVRSRCLLQALGRGDRVFSCCLLRCDARQCC